MPDFRNWLISLVMLLFLHPIMLFAQQGSASFIAESRWVDSVYNSLSTEERIAQLLVVRANQPNQEYDKRIDDYIRTYNIGGVTFFKGQPQTQLRQTNRWQQMAKTPLFVSIDAEWGLAMRLDGTVSYPLQMTLGAVTNQDLIYQMGRQIAEQCQRLGIHMNFAPVVDVNNNAENPVIGMRSFGDNTTNVSSKGIMYALGLQDGGILPTAKHFPGHGDTRNDSHYTLPVINHSRQHLDSIELQPFRNAINAGVQGIMIAHLHIPSLDNSPKTPTTLSEKTVTQLLKNEMGFKGLIVTDGLDMKGVTSVQPSGMIELMALQAGNDILLLPENVPLAIQTIKKALDEGSLPYSRLEESCRKVLSYKYRAGLNNYRPSFLEKLQTDLNKREYIQLKDQLFAEAVTLVRNDGAVLPLAPDTANWALLTIGNDKHSALSESLRAAGIKHTNFTLPKKAGKEQIAALRSQLSNAQHVIIAVHNTNILANRKFGIEDEAIAFANQVLQQKHAVLCIFASPYALDFFKITEKTKAILIGYQDRQEAIKATADILIGNREPMGKLPVGLKAGFKAGHGLGMQTAAAVSPEKESPITTAVEVAAIGERFQRMIDSVVEEGIQKRAFPGCQVVAMKDGAVIFKKSYGHLTYDKLAPVTDTTLYDLASLTKILASTLAIMKLHDDGLLKLTDRLSDFFPWLRRTDKAEITLMEILTHQSGFDGWIPYYTKTISKAGFDTTIYQRIMSPDFPYRVAENLYLSRTYKRNLFDEIGSSRLKSKEYRYSDLGFYFMPDLALLLTNKEFDQWLETTFYKPLGLKSLGYRPLARFPKNAIAPTEFDRDFRQQLLQGDVHDQGAAMMGGVSGHAGLFGNAFEVAQIMQLFLNGGMWKDQQLLKPETVNYFSKAHFAASNNRRGIGFDKPPLSKNEKTRAMAESASARSYGHTGFTGTFAWADPENGLVVVFLSNRVYPDTKTNQLAKLGTRPRIHEIFYQALNNSTANN
jgi:beta-N-acetylhexosaminidase